MSKLIERSLIVRTSDRKEIDPWVQLLRYDDPCFDVRHFMQEHTLMIQVGTTFRCTPETYQRAYKKAVNLLNALVYKEVNIALDEIEKAVHDRDEKKCFEIIDRLRKEIE